MKLSRARVLVDLSFSAVDYGGIPMETRLAFKALSQCPNLDTTGLLYPFHHTDVTVQSSRSAPPNVRIERQALALQKFLANGQDQSKVPGAFLRKLLRIAERGWRIFVSNRAQMEPLDSELFWDVVWRRWLSRSLTEDDVDLARRPMILSNVSVQLLNWKAYFNLAGPRLDTRRFDFALFHQARPIRVNPNTCKVVRHYDAIPIVRPDMFLGHSATHVHSRGLRACRNDSIFTCISEACRDELIHLYPDLAERAVTIPCTLATGFYPDERPDLLPESLAAHVLNTAAEHPPEILARMRQNGEVPPYLMFVSAVEPRKNHIGLIDAFEKLLASRQTDLCLVVVGSLGWNYDEILQRMAPLIRAGRLFHLHKVPQHSLRVLYSHAHGVVFPSLIEGFGYSPLEAMTCGAPVIASDIPVHRGVYGDAAEYFDPYRTESIAATIERVFLEGDETLRSALIQRGFRRVNRYQVDAVAAQWQALFEELKRQRITHNVHDARLADFNQELRRLEQSHETRGGTDRAAA